MKKKQASIFYIKRKTKNHTHAKTFMDHMIKHLVITSYQKLKKKKQKTCENNHRWYEKNLVIDFINESDEKKTTDMQMHS